MEALLSEFEKVLETRDEVLAAKEKKSTLA
jgi:hypothetical protein